MALLIPRIFHRIWIGPKPMPEDFVHWGKTWLRCNPGWEMRFWTEKNMPPIHNRRPYRRAPMFSGRADVARIELVYRFGGVYIDTDFECFKCIEPLIADKDHFFVREPNGCMSNAIFGAVPGHLALKLLIDGVMASWNSGERYVGLAGPGYFERTLRGYPGLILLPTPLLFPWTNSPIEERMHRGPKDETTYAAHYWAASG